MPQNRTVSKGVQKKKKEKGKHGVFALFALGW